MKNKRTDVEAFSISFLDIITCGFGAIILLLMIAKPGSLPTLDATFQPLDGVVRELQVQLFELRGEARSLNDVLNTKHEQLSEWKTNVARLESRRAYVKNQYDNLKDENTVNAIIAGEFELALQTLTDEMRRLMAQNLDSNPSVIGGIPVDSEYIIFIIDTSGSMVNLNWEKMINQLIATLDIYPNVKGLQIMSDMGSYMFSQYRNKWIKDSKGRRKVIINTLRTWNTFSNSSPVEGITQAIRSFYDPTKKISIYVFGDEFTGQSVNDVVDTVRRLNPKDINGNVNVRIHAVGFPIPPDASAHFQLTSKRFAILMRELTHENGGTFVGLN